MWERDGGLIQVGERVNFFFNLGCKLYWSTFSPTKRRWKIKYFLHAHVWVYGAWICMFVSGDTRVFAGACMCDCVEDEIDPGCLSWSLFYIGAGSLAEPAACQFLLLKLASLPIGSPLPVFQQRTPPCLPGFNLGFRDLEPKIFCPHSKNFSTKPSPKL